MMFWHDSFATVSTPILSCWADMDAFQLLDDTIVDVILKVTSHNAVMCLKSS